MDKKRQPQITDFFYTTQITTRWHDNDIYGHVNNVIYYSFFDSAVNKYLIEEAGLDIQSSDTIAYVVNSNCQYFSSLKYPESVTVALRVGKLGNSSVQYELGIYNDQNELKALGEFVHVFVEKSTEKPTPIPASIRNKLIELTY